MNRKTIREKGKVKLSRYFQNLKEGDKVSVIREPSLKSSFPERIGGKTGLIEGKRGRYYIVKLKDIAQEKRFIIEACHLKRIK